jgi:hypothetical protein
VEEVEVAIGDRAAVLVQRLVEPALHKVDALADYLFAQTAVA